MSCLYPLLNKMRVLTYTSYKEHYDLYTEIPGSVAVNSCWIELAQNDIILLSLISIIFYKAGEHTGVEKNTFTNFRLSVGTYSIGDFNTKIKEAVSQQIQDWEPLQIKDLKLVIPEHYTFMTDNTVFITLGISEKHLEKTTRVRSTLPPGSYKTSLDASPRPKSLSLHCKQINKVKNELDGQPSYLLARMNVSNHKASFSPMHLVFLELAAHRNNLAFKILDENSNEIIPRTFYLQLLNKQ